MNKPQGSASLVVIIAIVVVALAAGYFAFKKSYSPSDTTNSEKTRWQTLKGSGFEVGYPVDQFSVGSDGKSLEHVVIGESRYNEKDGSIMGPLKDITFTFYPESNDPKDNNSCTYWEEVIMRQAPSTPSLGNPFRFQNISGIRYQGGAEGSGSFRYCVKNSSGENIFVILRGYVNESYNTNLASNPGYFSSETQENISQEILNSFKLTNPTQPDETANWQTYIWGDLSFKYPSDWALKEEFYNTPAGQAEGLKPGLIALRLTSKATPQDAIGMGGRQFGCGHPSFPSDRKCLTMYTTPFYTVGTSTQSNEVFDKIISSTRLKNKGIEMILPKPGDTWETGNDYVVKWKVTEPGIKQVSVYIIDTRTEGSDGLTFEKYGLPPEGEIKISMPKGKLVPGKEDFFGPFIVSIYGEIPVPKEELPEGVLGVSQAYGASSAPLYIESTTGNPDFPPIPKG